MNLALAQNNKNNAKGNVTMEGVPRLKTIRTQAFFLATFSKKEETPPEKSQVKNEKETQKPEKKDSDNGFANRCIVDMYATTAYRRSGAYVIA